MPFSPEQPSENSEEQDGKAEEEKSSEQAESESNESVKPKNLQEAVSHGPINGGDTGVTQEVSKFKDEVSENTLKELEEKDEQEDQSVGENDTQGTDS